MSDPTLYNSDLAPIPAHRRTWSLWSFAALWTGMSFCVPAYMIAGSLIDNGMSWWQSLLVVFIGNIIVLIAVLLNSHAGAKYGISFPVLARASFGTRLANIPVIMRAVVACGWFGIQAWIGGYALYRMIALWWPGLEKLPRLFSASTGLEAGPAITFSLFLITNIYLAFRGMESLRKLLVFNMIVMPLAAIALLFWAVDTGNGFGSIITQPDRFHSNAEFWRSFFPALAGIVGFWSAVSLNVSDFTRLAVNQKSQRVGQTIGLPFSMTFVAFIGLIVTSVTIVVYGEAIWDPVMLADRLENKILASVALIAICMATLAANTAANVVGGANAFSTLAPSRISFRTGALITAAAGILIFPWKLMADPTGYIFMWLTAFTALLGPIAGIMIADYFLIRRQGLVVSDLYSANGIYTYSRGINLIALFAVLAGLLPHLPGFLVTVNIMSQEEFPLFFAQLYPYAWFTGSAVSFLVYFIFMKLR